MTRIEHHQNVDAALLDHLDPDHIAKLGVVGHRAHRALLGLEHLDDEEEHILPIAARCVTQEEWNGLGEHGLAKADKSQLPILFGAMLEEATPEERTMMLTLVPPPVRLLVRTVFAWQYRRYIKKVRAA